MVRQIVPVTDPRLRQKSRPVAKFDKKIAALIRDLKETLIAQKDPEGVGIAASQVGEFVRVFLIRHQGKILPFINPEIVRVSEQTPPSAKASAGQEKRKTKKAKEYIMEGCLSLPHYYGPVQRAWTITVQYQEPKVEDGVWKLEDVRHTFSAFPAQIIQHEIDHLEGKIFVDRLLEQNHQLFQLKNNEWVEVELP